MRSDHYGNAYVDGVCMLLNSLGKRCTSCRKPTFNECLTNGKCPACNGERPPIDYGSNGGQRCDTASGPCSCGAWH